MFIENLKMALSALLANKMRSFLTMLGIIIGIGSVIAITSIGDTVRQMVSSIYANAGITQSYIYTNIQDEEGARESDFFTKEDVEKYKKTFGSNLAYIDFANSTVGEVRTKLGINKMDMSGVDYNYINFQSFKMKYGRFFNKNDILMKKHVIILEDKSAVRMFGREDVVGRTYRQKFNSAMDEFTVIGVYHQEVSPLEKIFSGNNPNLSAYIPASLFDDINGDANYMLRIYGNKSLSGQRLMNFNDSFLDYVAKSKNRTKEEYIMSAVGSEMESVDQFLGAVSLGMGGIAAISLIVGGIGIMNIMLVSVTERTREIGTRKALGATTKDILTQFLIESAVLSAIGGSIGVGIAVGGISFIGLLIHQAVVIRPLVILLAVGFSALVGIFFGIYPARKAASRDPIIALRYE